MKASYVNVCRSSCHFCRILSWIFITKMFFVQVSYIYIYEISRTLDCWRSHISMWTEWRSYGRTDTIRLVTTLCSCFANAPKSEQSWCLSPPPPSFLPPGGAGKTRKNKKKKQGWAQPPPPLYSPYRWLGDIGVNETEAMQNGFEFLKMFWNVYCSFSHFSS